MPRFALTSIALFATLAALPAQVSTTAVLVGGNVQAGAASAPMPLGSAVATGLVRSCAGTTGSAGLSFGQVATMTALDIGWSLSCQANNTGASVAEATVRYTFVSPFAFTGRFVVEWNPTSNGTGASLLELDLGADGTVDANGAAVLPVTFGPNACQLDVHVRCDATAGVVTNPFGGLLPFFGAANGVLTIRLEPTHCVSQVVASACGQATFMASGTFLRGVEARGSVPVGTEIAILALGFAPAVQTIPLPPGCTVNLDAAALYWQPLNGVPEGVWTMSLGPSLLPVSFRAQQFALDVETASVLGSPTLAIDWH